jgi:hypothetical protein
MNGDSISVFPTINLPLLPSDETTSNINTQNCLTRCCLRLCSWGREIGDIREARFHFLEGSVSEGETMSWPRFQRMDESVGNIKEESRGKKQAVLEEMMVVRKDKGIAARSRRL